MMPNETASLPQRPRVCVDVNPELRRRLRMAAARADVSLREYLLQAIEEKLAWDMKEREGLLALSIESDPVLAELWDNEKDAAYDRL